MAHKRGTSDGARIEVARYSGMGSRIRGVIWGADPELIAHHRNEWPELWEAIDELVAHVDEQMPPFGRPGPT